MNITTAQAERIIKLATELGDAREARGSLSVWRKLLDHPEDAQYHAQSKLALELALDLQHFVEDLTKSSLPVVITTRKDMALAWPKGTQAQDRTGWGVEYRGDGWYFVDDFRSKLIGMTLPYTDVVLPRMTVTR